MSGNWPEVERRSGRRRRRDRRLDTAVSRRTYIGLFLFVVAFIIYGSLYPFQWYARPNDEVGAVAFLLSTTGDWDQSGNLAASILLYFPFGFVVVYALPLSLAGQFRAVAGFAAGVLLSVWMELAQYQDAGHVTTMGDVYASAIGLVLGITAGLILQGRRWSVMRALGVERVEAILLLLWAGDRLYPYVPVASALSLAEIVAPVMAPLTAVDPANLARESIRWLVVAYLAESLSGGGWWRLFPMFVLGEFAARVFIAGQTLSQADTCGAVVAFLLWSLLRHAAFGRALLAVGLVALVVTIRLAPFDFVGLPHGFGWLPFQSLMSVPLEQNVRTFFADGFLYGGLIWMLTRVRIPISVATFLTVLLLLLLAMAQCWTTGPAGEVTDALMAALIGCVLFLLGGTETADG
jgi:hypothetical protein